MLLLVLVLLLLFGGLGGGYYAHNTYGPQGLGGVLGLVLLIIVLVWLFGGGIGRFSGASNRPAPHQAPGRWEECAMKPENSCCNLPPSLR